MNDKKMLSVARKNIDKISMIRVYNRGHKFYCKDPEKIKYWINMCKKSEEDSVSGLPLLYLTKLTLK